MGKRIKRKKLFNSMYVKKLQTLRLDAGYTQADVAKHLGCTRSTYSYYETGKTRLSLESYLVLAELYRIPLSVLIHYLYETEKKVNFFVDSYWKNKTRQETLIELLQDMDWDSNARFQEAFRDWFFASGWHDLLQRGGHIGGDGAASPFVERTRREQKKETLL